MIDNERVKRLSVHDLKLLKDMCNEIDCWYLNCDQCPFELEEPYHRDGPYYSSYRCALGYAKLLYGRLHE